MPFHFRNFTDFFKGIVLLCLTGVFAVFTGCGPRLEYDIWKDTYKAFGNGEYQLMHSVTPEHVSILSLHNCKYNIEVLYNVSNYAVVDSLVYFYGYCPEYTYEDYEMFIALDTETNMFSAYYECTDNSDQIVSDVERGWQRNGVIKELLALSDLDTCARNTKEIFISLKSAGLE